jgi:bacteriocin biosynthesis cyclodehydratase domain-containing protein
VAEIRTVLGEAARPAVDAALALLAEHGLVTEGPPLEPETADPCRGAALLLGALGSGTGPADIAARLREARATIVGDGAVGAEVSRLLRLSGLEAVPRGGWEQAVDGLAVVAPSPAELPRLPKWNRRALLEGFRWLQVLPYDGAFAAIGPLYLPGESCCYECYRRRRAANVAYPREFWALERAAVARAEAPNAVAAAAGIAATLALRWLVLEDPFAAGVLATLELGETLRVETHTVYRLPRCAACSRVARLGPPLPWAEAS